MGALISLTFYKLPVTTRVTRLYFIKAAGTPKCEGTGVAIEFQLVGLFEGNARGGLEFAWMRQWEIKEELGTGNAIRGNSTRNFGVVYFGTGIFGSSYC